MLKIERVRAAFPHLERHVYLNTAAAGLSWTGQGPAAAEFYDSGKALGIGGEGEWAAMVAATKDLLAELLGVPPSQIHFVGSTTEALNLLALSFPLQRGDRVVMAEDEFPSVMDAWSGRQNHGVEIVHVPIPVEPERTEALCARIERGVKAVAVSHVHWRSGTRVDLEQLASACRKHDCRLIVDGVQAVGAVPVQAGTADAYCASVFKWLLSGFGLAFVTIGEQLAQELLPVFRGYSNAPPSRSLRYGHMNYPGVYALHASLHFLKAIGWNEIHQRVDQLALQTMTSLRAHGFDVLTPEAAHAGIVSVRHPDSSGVVRALAAESIQVEDRGSVVRISPHFYNSEADIERFAAAFAAHA